MTNRLIPRGPRKPLKKAIAPPKSSTQLAPTEDERSQAEKAQELILLQVQLVSNELDGVGRRDFLEKLKRAVYTQKPELSPEQRAAGFRYGRTA